MASSHKTGIGKKGRNFTFKHSRRKFSLYNGNDNLEILECSSLRKAERAKSHNTTKL